MGRWNRQLVVGGQNMMLLKFGGERGSGLREQQTALKPGETKCNDLTQLG